MPSKKILNRICRYLHGCFHGYFRRHGIKSHLHRDRERFKQASKSYFNGIKSHFYKDREPFQTFGDKPDFHSHGHHHRHGAFRGDSIYDVVRLSYAKPGVYKFIAVYCGEKLRHRLLEMGFVPGEWLTVIGSAGAKGSVMVKIKGAKIALGNEVAYKILLERKK